MIIDTDLGSDIDDLWALSYLLLINVPITLIHVSHRNTDQKAKLVAKILKIADRQDIPISIGTKTNDKPTRLDGWLKDFDEKDFQGKIINNGQDHLLKTLRNNPNMPILGLSPASSLGPICKRHPDLFRNRDLYQMAGSLDQGYEENSAPIPEWNIVQDIENFKHLLKAPWKHIYLIPLDRCGSLIFDGAHYKAIQSSENEIAKALISAYSFWDSEHSNFKDNKSSRLFDLATAHFMVEHISSLKEFKIDTLKIKLEKGGMLTQNNSDGIDVHIPSSLDIEAIKKQFISLIS